MVHRPLLVKNLYLALCNILVEKLKLVEATLKKLDAQGRIAIPAAWRRNWKSGKVILIKRGEKNRALTNRA